MGAVVLADPGDREHSGSRRRYALPALLILGWIGLFAYSVAYLTEDLPFRPAAVSAGPRAAPHRVVMLDTPDEPAPPAGDDRPDCPVDRHGGAGTAGRRRDAGRRGKGPAGSSTDPCPSVGPCDGQPRLCRRLGAEPGSLRDPVAAPGLHPGHDHAGSRPRRPDDLHLPRHAARRCRLGHLGRMQRSRPALVVPGPPAGGRGPSDLVEQPRDLSLYPLRPARRLSLTGVRRAQDDPRGGPARRIGFREPHPPVDPSEGGELCVTLGTARQQRLQGLRE